MASAILRIWIMGLISLVVLGFGVYFLWSWYDTGRQDTVYLASGIVLVLWTFAGRWILLPFFGFRAITEPKSMRSESFQRIARPDGTELQIEYFGPRDGPTLVLTHGWEQDSTEWYYFKRDLTQRFRLIVWDLPGLGRSTRPENRDYSLEKMARDLEAVVQLAGGPVVLVGHSIGGMVMQSFCRLFPQHLGERVVGLMLLDTTYTNPLITARFGGFWRAIQTPILVPACYLTIGISPLAWIMNWISYLNGTLHVTKRLMGFAGYQTWRQVDFSSFLSAKAPPAVIARGALATMKFDEWNTLPKISVPALILAGKDDRVTRFDANQQIEKRISTARLVPFEPAGHYALFEHHEAFGHETTDFLESLRGRLFQVVPPPMGFRHVPESARTPGRVEPD